MHGQRSQNLLCAQPKFGAATLQKMKSMYLGVCSITMTVAPYLAEFMNGSSYICKSSAAFIFLLILYECNFYCLVQTTYRPSGGGTGWARWASGPPTFWVPFFLRVTTEVGHVGGLPLHVLNINVEKIWSPKKKNVSEFPPPLISLHDVWKGYRNLIQLASCVCGGGGCFFKFFFNYNFELACVQYLNHEQTYKLNPVQ